MSKLTTSILIGLIIGIGALFAGNYILKHFLYSYVVPAEVLQAQTKPPLKIVNELLPQSLEINQQGTNYIVSWKTPQPVKSLLVFVKTNDDFSVYQSELKNTEKTLIAWVSKMPNTNHKITIPTNIKFKYFYIVEIQGTWAIPYGQKIFRDKGASSPYSLLKTE